MHCLAFALWVLADCLPGNGEFAGRLVLHVSLGVCFAENVSLPTSHLLGS